MGNKKSTPRTYLSENDLLFLEANTKFNREKIVAWHNAFLVVSSFKFYLLIIFRIEIMISSRESNKKIMLLIGSFKWIHLFWIRFMIIIFFKILFDFMFNS